MDLEGDMQTNMEGVNLKNFGGIPNIHDATTGTRPLSVPGSVPQQIAFLQQIPLI